MKFTVKTTDNYKTVFETKRLVKAIRYILQHDNSGGWYDLECHIDGGYNDVHVFTLVEVYYIIANITDDNNMRHILDTEFRYRPPSIGMNLDSQDYEQAREIAEYLLGHEISTRVL